jgi:hypothetical protein
MTSRDNTRWQIGGPGGPVVGDGYYEEGDDQVRVAIREGEPGWQVYNPVTDSQWAVFGQPQGGETREEAVFWAERLASKNGLRFERPEGWENIVGRLEQVTE